MLSAGQRDLISALCIVPDVLDLLDKSFALELFHVLVRHALDLFVPIFSHWNTPPVKMAFDEDVWQKALENCVPAKFLELNKKAFALGREVK